ncbi:MAG: hypothetical protein KJN63_10135 [Acidimicrobiia bacterium]|nr:hypothetical protein [Acidimicrobiia bacterium]
MTDAEQPSFVRRMRSVEAAAIAGLVFSGTFIAVTGELNLTVVCHDDGRMQVSAGPDACTNECVGGGIELTEVVYTWI